MKSFLPILLGLLWIANSAFAQKNTDLSKIKQKPLTTLKSAQLPTTTSSLFNTLEQFAPLSLDDAQKQARAYLGHPIRVVAVSPQGRPTWVSGNLSVNTRSVNLENQAYLYLDALKKQMDIDNPNEEFQITKTIQDEQGHKHIRMDQYYQGVQVYGGEVILHEKDGVISGLNGEYYDTPNLNIIPSLSENSAVEIAKTNLNKKVKIQDFPKGRIMNQFAPQHQTQTQLVIYHKDGAQEPHLAWQIEIHPNITEDWLYMVDAHNGEILTAHTKSCKFANEELLALAIQKAKQKDKASSTPKVAAMIDPLDGNANASGQDLNNVLRNFKSYHVDATNANYLIDITRQMFNLSASNMPDEPAGAIFTINGNNGSPQSSNFQVSHLTNSGTTWADKKAVSAHYNAGVAYDYYHDTHGRNSINGKGGTIYSIINVADENGQGMDNAFWNGQAMFYGNGKSAFKPLAGALDVAGHEISHGVIQNTPNLEYQGESGALNESFADIFGAMIDRDDWKMGEDVVFTSVFPTGALRDLSNPHNGGNALGDSGYQPAHVNEQYQGNQDNGGVHINSGITNKAYYLYATAIGKDKAEKVYYKALTDYLTKHSNFKDLRVAVLNAATDLFGAGSNEVAQVGPAFDQVGITGPSSGGTTNPGDKYQNDLEPNPGQDFIVYVDRSNNNKLAMADASGNVVGGFVSAMPSISPPAVTDDGTYILYVAEDKTVRIITFDWVGLSFTESEIVSGGDNRRVAIAPDASRMAVLDTNYTNTILVYDFGVEDWYGFDLYNPTYSEGVNTGNVDYPDVIQFDYSGEYIMYDAQSTLQNSQGQDVSYWDIGFVRVWNSADTTWGDGTVQKLFTGLPEGISIGNPAFAKNSPYIIAFDYIKPNSFELWGANIETGASAVIAQNDTYARPSYAPNDQMLVAAELDPNGTTRLTTVPLAPSKYELAANASFNVVVSDAKWGNWFANGSRSLVIANEEVLDDGKMVLLPNPFSASLSIQGKEGRMIQQVRVYDIQGRLILSEKANRSSVSIDLSSYSDGLYIFKVLDQNGAVRLFKAMKQ